MLRQQMRAFGTLAVGMFVVGWGGFTLLAMPEGTIPRELIWLGAVIAVGASLAAVGFAVVRARSRNRGR